MATLNLGGLKNQITSYFITNFPQCEWVMSQAICTRFFFVIAVHLFVVVEALLEVLETERD